MKHLIILIGRLPNEMICIHNLKLKQKKYFGHMINSQGLPWSEVPYLHFQLNKDINEQNSSSKSHLAQVKEEK